jgi:hypothetical protein
MISLPSPISVTPPPITQPDGSVKTFEPIKLDSIDYSVTYSNTRKIASVLISIVNRRLVLWQGTDYDAAGQFTDADVDARVVSLLAPDYATSITNLFKK